MKSALILLVVLFTTCPAFARGRFMLVEVMAVGDTPPKVNIYSTTKQEQSVGISIVEAATILGHAEIGMNMVSVAVLVEGSIRNKDLWGLFDALKKNDGAMLVYFETAPHSEDVHVSWWSEKARYLQASVRNPEYTKKTTP